MYFLLTMVISHCYVSLPEGTSWEFTGASLMPTDIHRKAVSSILGVEDQMVNWVRSGFGLVVVIFVSFFCCFWDFWMFFWWPKLLTAPSGELTWQLKSPIFNRRYIFTRSILCCHVSLLEGTCWICWGVDFCPTFFDGKVSMKEVVRNMKVELKVN